MKRKLEVFSLNQKGTSKLNGHVLLKGKGKETWNLHVILTGEAGMKVKQVDEVKTGK